jgi:hypothetical protein
MVNNSADVSEPCFKISAKGYLTALGYDVLEGRISPLQMWEMLSGYVEREATANCGEGLPCLVMVDGGHCITAAKKS